MQELIALLGTFDPALRVIMPSDVTHDFCEVEQAFLDTVQIRGAEVHLADERETERSTVVRLYGPEVD